VTPSPLLKTPIAAQIWDMKYRFKRPDGTPIDLSVEESWRRVAEAAAAAEAPAERARHARAFFDAMTNFRFIPAGRILAGAGTGRQVTLFNCFVMGTIPDDMAGIFESLKEAALTMQRGGGIGYDFSTLRPEGAPVHGIGAMASGPLSFMDVWDAMCRTIMSAGHRRGAMMATLAVSHPDIEAFIEAKRDPARLRMFNLSVLVTDAFMDAMAADRDWPLAFEGRVTKTVKARALWERIMRSTYETAEPGVIFIDRINKENNLNYCEAIAATNPCGEQPLPPYGACLLGSINLARLIDNPFTDKARLDADALGALTATAIRLLDNAIDISPFPLEAQRREAQAKRRIGLGVTGLADALIFCGLRYGSAEAAARTHDWLGLIKRAAYRASAGLAAEKGTFPLYDAAAYAKNPRMQSLDDETRGLIKAHGLRNGLLTSIAPTGTISLLAGNVSSGIEPPFAFSYQRRVLLPDGTARDETVEDYAVALFREKFGADAPLADYFVSAQTLSPAEHLAMQAATQAHIDASISKTINVPEGFTYNAFEGIYREAYRLGLKGCTTYRPNPVRGAVLSVAPQPAESEAKRSPASGGALAGALGGDIVYMHEPLARPETLPGTTYKLRWPESDHALYITINDIVQDGRRRPFEIFINSKNMEHYAWTVALTRMISAVFRRGGDVSFVVDELKAVFDPRGGQWMEGHYVPSLLAAIGDVIERHLIETGFLAKTLVPPPETLSGRQRAVMAAGGDLGDMTGLRSCPRCFSPGLTRAENCDLCLACGYSRCT
jgi:ribonucleoside-diphosphate reductase alpha chain